MNLGETIYRLRTQHNMSQGDLADALDVSRQSVSKWENGNATPDLERLVKMSQLFEISLDELITGTPAPAAASAAPKPRLSQKQITGIVLLALGLLPLFRSLWFFSLANLISRLLLVTPLILCGILCLKTKFHTGLYCTMVVYLWLWLPLGIFSPNFIRFDFARILQLVHIVWGAGLVLFGVLQTKKEAFFPSRKKRILYYLVLLLTMTLSLLILYRPGLLPTPGLLR